MLIKHDHRLPKINKSDMRISYIGLNLVLGPTHSLLSIQEMHPLLYTAMYALLYTAMHACIVIYSNAQFKCMHCYKQQCSR